MKQKSTLLTSVSSQTSRVQNCNKLNSRPVIKSMKRVFFTLLIILSTLLTTAQVTITVNVATAGSFSSALTAAGGDKNTVTNLTVTGNIDGRDVEFMRDNMPVLSALNLAAVQIIGYGSYYPANEMPQRSFCNSSWVGKTSLTSITLPTSITSIGNYAFCGCNGLTGTLTIPTSVTSIGDGAFNNCRSFSGSLIIPVSVTSIGQAAFYNCSGFSGSLTIPNSVTNIRDLTFYGCNGLTGSLTIPSSVTTIGNSAFSRTGFTGILTIPSSVNSIGNAAFLGCNGFTGNLTIPLSVTSIASSAFQDCSGFNGNLTIPTSITAIEGYAFEGCSSLTGNLVIPNSVSSIGSEAFYNCSGFTGNLTIPTAVTSIGDGAFYNCSGLTGSLTIPSSITSIGSYTFQKCSGLNGSLTIPSSVTSIGYNAFSGCIALTGNLAIPTSVTSIGSAAFEGCKGFTGNLIIPSTITSIGSYAFYGCRGLTGSLTIPSSITSIEEGAFGDCYGLTGNLTIPNSITSIGSYAFQFCSGLTNITIPSSVITIGDGSFFGCSGLQKIKVNKAIPISIGSYTFDGVNKTSCELVVPVGSKAAYQTADYWKDFNIITEAIFVNYNSQGGSVIADTTVVSGTKLVKPATPIKGSYTFGGWYKEAEYTNAWDFTTDVVTTNTTLYAKWGFQVSFNSQGGSPVPDIVSNYSSIITAPTAPIKTGFTFGGWYKEVGCTNAWVFASDIVSANTTLYAKWSCSVSFNSQGGSIVSDVVTDYNSHISAPTAPVKVGYTFRDWYKEAECTNIWHFTTDAVTTNTTLYAKWAINSYTVNFNSQGGSSVSSVTTNYNTHISEPTTPAKTGYTFGGWYKEVECTNTWNFATDVVTENTTLYAKWMINSYTVTFNSQGGNSVPDITTNYNTHISEPSAPNKTGYSFGGWYKEATCTILWVFTTDVVTTNTTLYAKWIINTGIEEKNAGVKVTLFPNPAIDHVILRVENLTDRTLSYQLYNILGNLLDCRRVFENETTISLKNYLPSTYILKLTEGNGKEVKTFKIMKK